MSNARIAMPSLCTAILKAKSEPTSAASAETIGV